MLLMSCLSVVLILFIDIYKKTKQNKNRAKIVFNRLEKMTACFWHVLRNAYNRFTV